MISVDAMLLMMARGESQLSRKQKDRNEGGRGTAKLVGQLPASFLRVRGDQRGCVRVRSFLMVNVFLSPFSFLKSCSACVREDRGTTAKQKLAGCVLVTPYPGSASPTMASPESVRFVSRTAVSALSGLRLETSRRAVEFCAGCICVPGT